MMDAAVQQQQQQLLLVGSGSSFFLLGSSRSSVWGTPPHALPPHHPIHKLCLPIHSSLFRVSQHDSSFPPSPRPCSDSLFHLLATTLFPSGVFSSSSCEVSSTTISKRIQMGIITYRTPGSWVCFGGGKRPRRPRVWKTRQRIGTINKSQKLLERVRTLSNVKEEVYGALDAFIAWEIEFPLVAVKKALKTLKWEKDWKRIIQISKWMIGKGQGKTLGTYLLLLEAFDAEGRIEEAQELWQKVFNANLECTPRNFFSRMIFMYDHHGMQEELLETFADMEELNIRPDAAAVDKIALTYQKIGDLDRAERVKKKYSSPKWRYRTVNGRSIRIRNSPTTQNGQQSSYRDETYLPGSSRDEDLTGTYGEGDFADIEGEEEEVFTDSEGEEDKFGTDNHHCAPRQATVDGVQFVQ